MKKYRINLGDGKYIEGDTPSKSVLRAFKRIDRAMKQGRGPNLDDTEIVFQWLEDQDRKYGGIHMDESKS